MTKHFLRVALGAAAVVGLGMGTTGALADGYYVGSVKDTAPLPAPVAYEWNGFSVGAGLGVGRLDQDVSGMAGRKDTLWKCEQTNKSKHWDLATVKHECYRNNEWSKESQKDTPLGDSSSDDVWSAFGTLQVGYDRLITDRILLGAFADFDFYRDADLTLSDQKDKGDLSGRVERDNMWTVGGRLGFLASPRILIYGLAGYSQMRLDGSLVANFADPYYDHYAGNDKNDLGHLPLKVKDNVGGWTVGGGIEAKLEKRLSLKLEYRYSHFDGASAALENDGDDYWMRSQNARNGNKNYTAYHQEFGHKAKLDLGDTDVHAVRAVLSFKLGRDEEPIAPLK